MKRVLRFGRRNFDRDIPTVSISIVSFGRPSEKKNKIDSAFLVTRRTPMNRVGHRRTELNTVGRRRKSSAETPYYKQEEQPMLVQGLRQGLFMNLLIVKFIL